MRLFGRTESGDFADSVCSSGGGTLPGFDDISANAIVGIVLWAMGSLFALAAVFGRKSLRRIPLAVLLIRAHLFGCDEPPILVAPGFSAPDLRVGRFLDGLPPAVRLVGLLDGLAFGRLRDLLEAATPGTPLEICSHDRVDEMSRPLISLGGPSVNELTGSILAKSLMQRGVWMKYPEHVSTVLDRSYVLEYVAGEAHADYGFLVFTRNEWNPTTGCCLVYGVYPAGTWAAVRLLEDPMRFGLLERMTDKSTPRVWIRLILDHLRIKHFRELEGDWVVVVRSPITATSLRPGEPTIEQVDRIPPLTSGLKGWTKPAQEEFWKRASDFPGWTGVGGDEAGLSTTMTLEWLSTQDFAGQSILEYGCGVGRLFSAYLGDAPPVGITAVDIVDHMLRRAEDTFKKLPGSGATSLSLVKGDADALDSFEEGQFDTVVCWTVLNHIINNRECKVTLRRLCRLARHRIILCDPVCNDGDSPYVSAAYPSHRRRLSFYRSIVRDSGFEPDCSLRLFGSPAHPEARRAVIVGNRVAQE